MTAETKVLPTKKRTTHLELYSESPLPTERGQFRIVVFRDRRNGREHVAMVKGEIAGREGVPVRVHSECLTSEVFGSLRCDCRAQLDRALDFINQQGCGVVLYLRQEGRGIGLGNKIRAYKLQQEEGLDTVDANLKLGFADDLRRYDVAAEIIRQMGIRSISLLTNNPNKFNGLSRLGVTVAGVIPLRSTPNEHNAFYLDTKRIKSGHRL